MVTQIHQNTGGQSLAATGAAASNLDLYQIKSTYYSALACKDRAYLAARALQFFTPSVPQVYYVGALAGTNDMDLLERTHNGRDINRRFYSCADIDCNLQRPVVQSLNALCRLRNTLDAFDGDFSYEVDEAQSTLTLLWQGNSSWASLQFKPGQHQDDTDPSLATLEWADTDGHHCCTDLLNDLPAKVHS